ncbi:MAG: alpha/beta hydrolase [Bacteroidota bacterium]
MKNVKSRLDKNLVPVVEMLSQSGYPLDLDNDLEGARAIMKAGTTQALELGNQIKGVEKQLLTAPSRTDAYEISMFVYRPTNQDSALPLIYWTHGGGLVVGDAQQDDLLLRNFVNELQCVVVSVEYRLAPEHPFPTPIEDIYSGLKWAFEQADKLKIDPTRIIIGGASAGGGLTAALAQIVRDRKELSSPLIYQLLMYPMLDNLNTMPLPEDEEDTYVWTKANNISGWKYYLGQPPQTEDLPVYASAARMDNLEGLPPAMIIIGDIDLFSGENIEYARRLNEAGVSTELHVYPGGIHGFELLTPDSKIGQNFISSVYSGLRNAINGHDKR